MLSQKKKSPTRLLLFLTEIDELILNLHEKTKDLKLPK